MTPEERDVLARKMAASRKWKWEQGMNVAWAGGRHRIAGGDVFNSRDAWPDFTDAATVGVVLNQAVQIFYKFRCKSPSFDFVRFNEDEPAQIIHEPAGDYLSAAFAAARHYGLVHEAVVLALYLFFSEMEER